MYEIVHRLLLLFFHHQINCLFTMEPFNLQRINSFICSKSKSNTLVILIPGFNSIVIWSRRGPGGWQTLTRLTVQRCAPWPLAYSWRFIIHWSWSACNGREIMLESRESAAHLDRYVSCLRGDNLVAIIAVNYKSLSRKSLLARIVFSCLASTLVY